MAKKKQVKKKEAKKTVWTRFMDMHSGGSKKLEASTIYIEAPEKEAKVIFYNKFGRNPSRVTCTCCGEDYSISESESLEDASAYDRGCTYAYFRKDNGKRIDGQQIYDTKKQDWVIKGHPVVGRYVEEADKKWGRTHIPLKEYIKSEEVAIIPASEIREDERIGELPDEGYVWVD